jgi:hypothetical protein
LSISKRPDIPEAKNGFELTHRRVPGREMDWF